MFHPISNGSVIEINDNAFGFVFKCHIPPIGYGVNSVTGKVEETDILDEAEYEEDNYWIRPQLPKDFYSRRKDEKKIQELDKYYVDPYLEEIRRREWGRRIRGIWFPNYNPKTDKVEYIYITGLHYLYITYWKFQGKYMDFRMPDRDFFYVLLYCMFDPDCLGINELTRRKNGKCFGKNTLIRMFDGTTKFVQDILDGEYVMGDDSTKRLVSGVISGQEILYKITANKGEGFVCNESHILALLWNGKEKPNYKGWKKGDKINISVKEYLGLKQSEKEHLVMYRRGWGNHFAEIKHIIPPYMIGVYLGDGSSHCGSITTTDHEVLDFVKTFAENLNLKLSVTKKITYRLSQKGDRSEKDGISLKNWAINPYKAELKRLNILGNKHIPKEYLLDSENNRLELLAGIIDTDGYLDSYKGKPRKYEITQKNITLANDIAELSRSLGFFASCIDKKATMKRSDGTEYSCIVKRIEIYGDIERIPCKILRKKAKATTRRKNSLNFGFSIEPIGNGDYYGFTVDKNNLFLLADGTVVHNTARAGCWLYERTSRMNNHHGGIQSKSDDDAQEFFKKAVRDPWKHLPDFFRPVYDIMKGDSPNDELRFFAPSKRGSRAEEESETLEEPLDSFIDFKPAIESAYDGPELHSYVSDESGKVKKPTSIKERQNVVRFCTEIEGFFNGKHYFTTTVESEKDEQENVEFQELTANSNPLERNENNRTVTGLYTYFLPAHKSMNFDKYGFANEEAAEKYIVNTLKAYQDKGDTRGMSSFKRKYPRTIKEAFSTDGEYALYNPELLNNQLDDIQWTHHFTEFGDLEWENGNRISVQKVTATGELIYEPSKVIWKPNPKGKFEKIKDWFPKNPNDVFYQGGHYHPNNNFSYRIGCDPFRYDKTKDKRRSNCAAFVYQLPDPHYPNDIYDDAFVLRYSYREESTRASNEDVLKMAWWCGCKILFERNVNHWKSDFTNWECGGFLKWLPGEVEPGINTAGNAVQAICNYTEAYINKFISKVYFKTLIRKETGWLGFKVEDTEKFDEPMAAGITLIHVREEQARKQHYTKDISEYFSKDSGWTY